MASVPVQIRIDRDIKQQAAALFSQLGLDMSSAVNVFLRQCLLCGGLPFSVAVPRDDARAVFRQPVLEAMDEARRISRDPNVKGYTDLSELKKALEE